MKYFLLAFFGLFIAIDPVGILPLYVEIAPKRDREKIARQSMYTAFLIGVAFLLFGKGILDAFNIKVEDFQIAGGSILFVLALQELFVERKRRLIQDIGVVPLGTPLIVGPATLTSLLLFREIYGLSNTLFAFILNLLLLFLGMIFSNIVLKHINPKVLKAIGKVIAILLASIGVMMVRLGIEGIVKGL